MNASDLEYILQFTRNSSETDSQLSKLCFHPHSEDIRMQTFIAKVQDNTA